MGIFLQLSPHVLVGGGEKKAMPRRGENANDAIRSLLKTPKAKEILEFFGIQSLGTGGLDRSVAINGRPDRACQGLVSDPVSASGPVGSLLSPW